MKIPIKASPGFWYMAVGLFCAYGVYFSADHASLVGVVIFGLAAIVCFFAAGIEVGRREK